MELTEWALIELKPILASYLSILGSSQFWEQVVCPSWTRKLKDSTLCRQSIAHLHDESCLGIQGWRVDRTVKLRQVPRRRQRLGVAGLNVAGVISTRLNF